MYDERYSNYHICFRLNGRPIRFLALLLFLNVGTDCYGQQTFLMLQKKNKNKNAYYKPGDKISFRIDEGKKRFTGEIVQFEDSTIVFKGFEVELSRISSLYIDEKTRWWLRYKVEQLAFILGGGYLLLNLINDGELTEETLIVSGSLIGAGLLARAVIGNRIRIGDKTKLRIVRL